MKNILLGNIKQCLTISKRSFASKNILTLLERGFIQDVFPSNAGSQMKYLFETSPQILYAGFDPTADSLHVGNLLIIMGLLHCQRKGHQPIALIGGASGLIGDPSGRSTERVLLAENTVEENAKIIRHQIENVFHNHGKYFNNNKNEQKDVTIVNNTDWYSPMKLIDFISTTGRHFRMGSMLSRSSVQTRLNSESGMSFTEFTYQIFQAFDWLHLVRNFNCRFQFGGSDQMGNIMSGHELISRAEKKHVYGLTLPLVTNEEGDKYGKSAGNAIWLSSDKTSPFAFYQFFLRSQDNEVQKLLSLFTFLPTAEIKEIMKKHQSVPELRDAQRRLAEEVTLLIHGEEGLKAAESVTEALYKGNVDVLGNLNQKDVAATLQGATTCELLMEPGFSLLDVAMKAKCFPTKNDAVRIITAGGFYVNQKRSSNIAEVLSPGVHILKNGLTILRVGKKNYYIVRWLN